MYFELWDTETRSLLDDFEMLHEALEASRELVERNPGVYPEKLALVRVEDGESTTWLGAGSSLQTLLTKAPVSPT